MRVDGASWEIRGHGGAVEAIAICEHHHSGGGGTCELQSEGSAARRQGSVYGFARTRAVNDSPAIEDLVPGQARCEAA